MSTPENNNQPSAIEISNNIPLYEEIQKMVENGVDISSYQERIDTINDKKGFTELIQSNIPITGSLQFGKLFNRFILTEVKQDKETVKQDKETVKQDKETVKQDKETTINLAAKISNEAAKKLEEITGGAYKEVIKNEIDQVQKTGTSNKPELGAFLQKLGVKGKPEELQNNPDIIAAVSAHVSTRVYLENRGTITKDHPDAQKFIDDLEMNRFELGLTAKIEANQVSRILGDIPRDTRDATIAQVNNLTKESPNTLITRTGDKLTWDGAREGEKFEIDMSVHPPKLSKSQNGLSISRTEVPENPELKDARESLNKSKNAYQEASKDIHSDLKSAGYYQSLDNFSLEEVEKAFSGEQFDVYREKIQDARTLEEKEKLQQEIRTQATQSEGILTKKGFAYMDQILSEKIEMGKIGIENAGGETATEQDLNNKLHILENLKSSDKLTTYTETRRKYEKENEAIKKMETPGVDTFSENASETLSLLNSLGYGELGQQGLDELLEAMNLHNKGTVESINLDRNPKLDPTQERILRELAEKLRERSQQGETKVALQQLGTALKNQSFRAQHWNTREQREQFLFPNSKVGNSPKTPSEAQK